MKNKKGGKYFSIVRWSILGLFFFILFIVFILFVTNNSPFLRKYAINSILPLVNSSLIAKIELGDLKFKSFNSLILRNFRLITDGDTLAQFSELDLKIKLSELWKNKILIRNLTIKNLKIKLLRNPIDSIWNYDRISPPTPEDTEPGKTPLIVVSNLIIQNAQFKLFDPFYHDSSLAFNPMDLNLKDLNIHLKADLDFDNSSIYSRIHNISFVEENTDARLDSLKFAVNISNNYTKLDYLQLFTDTSAISIFAELINFNPLSSQKYNEIEDAKINSRIQLKNVSTDFPMKFLYLPFKKNEYINSQLSLQGTINEYYSQIHYIHYRNTEIYGNAKVWFDENSLVHYSASLDNSIVYQQDINNFLDIDLSSVPKYEIAKFDNLEVYGTERDVEIKSRIKTTSGDISFSSKVIFDNTLTYEMKAELYNINLGRLFSNSELLSSLNGIVEVSGKGDNLNNMLIHSRAKLSNSTFRNIAINETNLKINLTDGIISLDTVSFRLPDIIDTVFGFVYPSSLNFNGLLDFRKINAPTYDINLSLQNINLSKIANNALLPSNLTFNSRINGQSLDIEKIQLHSLFDIQEITFSDITFLPFNLSFHLTEDEDSTKRLFISFMQDTISVIGKYSINEIITKLPELINYSTVYFQTRYDEFFLRTADSVGLLQLIKMAKNIQLPNIDAIIQLKFNNFFFLNSFLKDVNISTSINWSGNIRSSEDNAFVDFSYCKIGNSKLSMTGFELELDDFITNFSINLVKKDTTINLTFGNLNIDDLDGINFNNIRITKPRFNFVALDNKFSAEFGLKYDTLMTAYTEINGEVLAESINFTIPQFNVSLYDNVASFRNVNTPEISFDNDGIKVDNLDMIGKNKEMIYIDAWLEKGNFENTKIRLENFKLSNYASLLKQFQIDELAKSRFNLNYLQLVANGNLENPRYEMEALVDTASVMGIDFGKIIAQFSYLDSNVIGKIELKEKSKKPYSPLVLQLISFPYNLSLTDRFGTFSGSYIARLELDTFKLGVIDPFLPIVRNLSGTANGFVDLVGTDFDNYSINGQIKTSNTNFILEMNNLPYSLAANIKIKNNAFYFDTVEAKNYGINSLALVTGLMRIDKNELSYLDLNVKANNFLLLDEVSRKKIPQFYGKLSVSTKNEGMNIRGNPNSLVINGDVQINPSNIVIANLDQQQQTTKTNFDYKIIGDKTVITVSTTTDTTKERAVRHINTAQMPDVEMNVFIPKTINLKIDLGAIGEIVAILGSADPTVPLVYLMDKDNPMGQLFGELVIKDGSTLNSYKRMKAKGTISFQSRDITNPFIDIIGEYNGRIEDPNNPIRYTIQIFITGTAQSPKVRFDYTLNGIQPQAEQKKIEENALYLLLFGQLPGSGDAMLDPNVVNKLSSAGISSVASRSISDLLLQTGVIESADFQIDSQDFEKTKINLKGKLYGSLNWSIGGSIADLTKNNQITIEMPISTDSKLFNQIIWMLSYSTNLNSTVFEPDEKNWEMKLKFGGSW